MAYLSYFLVLDYVNSFVKIYFKKSVKNCNSTNGQPLTIDRLIAEKFRTEVQLNSKLILNRKTK
jgi:hypothetical protein